MKAIKGEQSRYSFKKDKTTSYLMSIKYLIEVYTQPYVCIASLKFWFAYKRQNLLCFLLVG